MKERLYFMERERDLWMKQCLEAQARVAELEATLRECRESVVVMMEDPDTKVGLQLPIWLAFIEKSMKP